MSSSGWLAETAQAATAAMSEATVGGTAIQGSVTALEAAQAAAATVEAVKAAAAEAGGSFSLGDFLSANRHMFLVEARLFALTLAIIYAGAHGALQRPHSAAPRRDEDEEDDKNGKDGAKKKKRRRRRHSAQASKEGLQASDAIMLPVFASFALVGFYYLIQYLQDPALLSRIVRTYSSIVAVASLGKLLADALSIAVSLVFPNVWAGRGTGGATTVFRISPVQRQQMQQVQQKQAEPGAAEPGAADSHSWTVDPTRPSPFPDRLAWLARSPTSVRKAWAWRRLFTEAWSVRVSMHGIGAGELGGITLNTMIGALLSLGLTVVYYFFGDASSASSTLNNVLGLGFCYGGLLLVSCTSFGIGSLVLVGLFVYDIVMVFYTPFMVTVATKLDAPIKLVARSGDRSSLLGLGDIVVPGIYICLCLRYDLYRFYARKIHKVPVDLTTETAVEDTSGTTTTAVTVTQLREVKTPFIDPQGRWGDRLWTSGAPWGTKSTAPSTPGLAAAAFPKPCFYVAMVAYVVGLLLAVGTMLFTGRGQPALLYLVPSLVLSTWGWGYWAGELKHMWAYTEDGTADVKDVVVELGPDGKPIEKKKEEDEDNKNEDDDAHDVFLFAVRAPAEDEVDDGDY